MISQNTVLIYLKTYKYNYIILITIYISENVYLTLLNSIKLNIKI